MHQLQARFFVLLLPALAGVLFFQNPKKLLDKPEEKGEIEVKKEVEKTKKEKIDVLIQKIILKESSGDDRAIGDKNLSNWAYGPLQIRKPVCDDVNRKFGTNYRAEDCLGNRALSIKIYHKYLSIYATRARLGREPTDEDRARIWNGGPNGYKKSSTLVYWQGVQEKVVD